RNRSRRLGAAGGRRGWSKRRRQYRAALGAEAIAVSDIPAIRTDHSCPLLWEIGRYKNGSGAIFQEKADRNLAGLIVLVSVHSDSEISTPRPRAARTRSGRSVNGFQMKNSP